MRDLLNQDKCTDMASSEGFIRGEEEGVAWLEGQGGSQGEHSFKSIGTCHLVAGKERFETDG